MNLAKFIKLGNFVLSQPTMFTSDPAYKTGTQSVTEIPNCRTGSWEAGVLNEDYGKSKLAIKTVLLAIRHETGPAFDQFSLEENGTGWERYPRFVCVSTAKAGFFDASVYQDDSTASDMTRQDYGGPWLTRCTYLAWSDIGAGVFQGGVVSSSGWGDGYYELFFHRNLAGEVDAAFLTFGDDPEYDMQTMNSLAAGEKKWNILIDLDDVLWNLLEPWTEELRARHGTNIGFEDVDNWDMTKIFPGLTKSEIFGPLTDPDLYARCEPLEGAVSVTKWLVDLPNTNVKIATATNPLIASQKISCFLRLFPHFSWRDIIITFDKSLIKGDIIIDDAVHNLETADSGAKKILFSRPHNLKFHKEKEAGVQRVCSWGEIREIISKIV